MTGRGDRWSQAGLIVVRHPSLWAEALRSAWSVSRRGLWRPHDPYLKWRALTAYGNEDAPFQETDLTDYLRWRRRMRRGAG